MEKRICAVLLTVCALALLGPIAGFAQDEGWEVPEDYVPPDSSPVVPPPPAAPFGPVLFDEAEFPFGGLVDGFVTNTVGGMPLDGPLSFAAPAGATFNIGPGVTALIDPPGIIGQTAGALTIDFGVDVSEVSFNFALQCGAASNGQIDVTAFDSSSGFVGMTTVAGQDMGFFFIENQVAGFSPGVFRSIDIALNSGPGCNAYAIDFLSWDTVAAAPAMGAPWLAALAALLLGAGAWLVRRRASVARR